MSSSVAVQRLVSGLITTPETEAGGWSLGNFNMLRWWILVNKPAGQKQFLHRGTDVKSARAVGRETCCARRQSRPKAIRVVLDTLRSFQPGMLTCLSFSAPLDRAEQRRRAVASERGG